MNRIKLILFLCLAFNLNAKNGIPSDTTVSLKDRTAALLLVEEGKNLFLQGKFRESLIKLKLAGNKDAYQSKVPLWSSFCHLKMKNYGYALQYAQKARELSKELDTDVAEILAYSFHENAQIDSALVYYNFLLTKLSKQRIQLLRINDKIASCNLYKENPPILSRKSFSESVNSGYNDYNPIIIKDGKVLYFTSRRENTTGGLNNPDDEQYFEDNYRAVWNEELKDWDSITNKLERVNSSGFDCISYLSNDELSGLMTLNNTAVEAKKQTQGSDICEISLSNKGKWQTPKIIVNKSINSSFFDGAACLSADGNTMYFVSDRRGDKSMTDIYIVQKVNNKWGKAELMSDSINTPYRETTPYITEDGRYLFFSSDGHTGYGGYDVYVSENMGKYWSKAINLGPYINTVNDDTHFTIYKKMQKALMTGCNNGTLKSDMDIYEIDLSKIKLPIKL